MDSRFPVPCYRVFPQRAPSTVSPTEQCLTVWFFLSHSCLSLTSTWLFYFPFTLTPTLEPPFVLSTKTFGKCSLASYSNYFSWEKICQFPRFCTKKESSGADSHKAKTLPEMQKEDRRTSYSLILLILALLEQSLGTSFPVCHSVGLHNQVKEATSPYRP